MSDPYALCSCGSGKKFRFCCQGIASTLEKAYSQARAGQLDSALRTMDQAVTGEPKNLELRLHKAKLLDALKRRPEAEKTIDEALAIDAGFAPAHFQRALWRRQEGEIPGAAILARKAVDLYPLEAKEQIAQVYAFLSQVEAQLGRPIAARNALRMATRLDPSNSRYLDGFEAMYGEKSGSPSFIRREYSLLSPPPGSKRRAAWDKLAKEHRSGRLSDLAKMFNTLATQDPQDPAAAFNAALTSAWLGDNGKALENLGRYFGLETDPARKETALILAEALRAGHGSEPGDHALHEFFFLARNPSALDRLFAKLGEEKRFLVHQADESEQGQTMIEAYILAKPETGILTPGEESKEDRFARVVAHLSLNMPLGRVTGSDKEAIEKLRQEFAETLGWGDKDHPVRATGALGEIAHEPLVVPLDPSVTEDEMKARQAKEVVRHFEEIWVNKPLKSLEGKSPLEAVKTDEGKARVAALVRFHEEVSFVPKRVGYHFNQLRKLLGLTVTGGGSSPSAASETAPAPTSPQSAFQAALQGGNEAEASRLAEALLAAPPGEDDRFAAAQHLAKIALAKSDWAGALTAWEKGHHADRGPRKSEYLARQSQCLVKLNRADEAAKILDGLASQENAAALKALALGVEALVSAGKGSEARKLAEAGKAQAAKLKDRDAEGHFAELAQAAGKI